MIHYQKEYDASMITARIFPEGVAYVCNLIVYQNYVRQGLGTSLYKEFEEKCRQNSCTEVFLEVFTKNIIGKKFWTSLGFEFTGEICNQEYETWRKVL